MKVGVTGASGFIGRKLTKKLLDSGYEVKKFVRREPQSEDEIYWSPSKKEIDKFITNEIDIFGGKIKSKLIKFDLKEGIIRVDHKLLIKVRDIMNKNEALKIKTIRTSGTLKALEKE